jgi:hypothetical protein
VRIEQAKSFLEVKHLATRSRLVQLHWSSRACGSKTSGDIAVVELHLHLHLRLLFTVALADRMGSKGCAPWELELTGGGCQPAGVTPEA